MTAENSFRDHIKKMDDENLLMTSQALEIQAKDHPKKKLLPDWNITYVQAHQICVDVLEKRTRPDQNGSES